MSPEIQKFDTIGTRSHAGSRFDLVSEQTILFDLLETRIHSRQQYELMAYQPYCIVHYYRLFATPKKPDIKFPRQYGQTISSRKENEGIIQLFQKEMKPQVKLYWHDKKTVRCDLVPYITRILSPDFRPVNSHLVKSDERTVLDRLVALMNIYGLTFCVGNSADGRDFYELYP